MPAIGLSVIGVYVPYPDGPLKESIWRALIAAAERHANESLIIAGDFNSCHPHEADSGRGYTVEPLQAMCRVASDLWRASAREPRHRDQITWEGSNGKGNRLDFVFGTPPIQRILLRAEHRHALRQSKASDHSGVVVDLDLRC